MNENLLGYLLNALEPDEQRQLEQARQQDETVHKRLEVLRRCLAPLAADAEAPKPPADLVARTLALIERAAAHNGPLGARATLRIMAPPVQRSQFHLNSWRRVDALVAAGIVIAVISLALPVRNSLYNRAAVSGCQNNLRMMHTALSGYSDHHDGDFPHPEVGDPRHNFAGVFVPALQEEGYLGPLHSVTCSPAGGRPAESPTMRQLNGLPKPEFEKLTERAGGSYAYSLGYRDASGYHGLHRDPDSLNLPIMADRPPTAGLGNSPNHGGSGQNILFVDGHVQFATGRRAGFKGDDIYLNQAEKVGAGLNHNDTVLGESKAKP